jgi:hypothetical protein
MPLLRVDNPHIAGVALLIGRAGNLSEKETASQRLIELAEDIASDSWRESQRSVVARMNAGAVGSKVADEERALDAWQRRHLTRVYDAMTALGGEWVLDHCREVVADSKRRRAQHDLAVAVLAAHDRAKTTPIATARTWGMPPAQATPWAQPGTSSWGTAPNDNTRMPGAPPSPPRAVPEAEAPTVSGGNIINVDEVVAALRPYLKQCYQRALAQEGRFGAWIMLEARVVADGSVSAVTGKGDDSAPVSMMTCLRYVVMQARFAPPDSGAATVSIPLTFTVQEVPAPPLAPPPAPQPQPPVQPSYPSQPPPASSP